MSYWQVKANTVASMIFISQYATGIGPFVQCLLGGSNSRPPARRGVNMINVSYALTTRPRRRSRHSSYHEFRNNFPDCRRTSLVLTTQTLNLGNKTVGTGAPCPPNFSSACSPQPQFTNLQTLQCCIRTTCSILSSKNHPTHTKPSTTLLNLLILLSGDVSPNPGPRAPKYPCGVCCKL